MEYKDVNALSIKWFEEGDKKAREELLEIISKTIYSKIRKLSHIPLSKDDVLEIHQNVYLFILEMSGNFKHDHELGNFYGYVYPIIGFRVMSELRSLRNHHLKVDNKKTHKIRLLKAGGATHSELIEMGFTDASIKLSNAAYSFSETNATSMHSAESYDDDEDSDIMDKYNYHTEDHVEEIYKDQLLDLALEEIKQLPERNVDILYKRVYDLKTSKELGEKYGISHQRVDQIRDFALKSIKEKVLEKIERSV